MERVGADRFRRGKAKREVRNHFTDYNVEIEYHSIKSASLDNPEFYDSARIFEDEKSIGTVCYWPSVSVHYEPEYKEMFLGLEDKLKKVVK